MKFLVAFGAVKDLLGRGMEPVVIITHEFFPFPGGIAVYVREMALAMAAAGHPVEVWCPAHPELARQDWPFRVVPLHPAGSQSWPCRFATARVWRERAGTLRNATVWLPEPGAILTACHDFIFRLPKPRRLVLTLHGSEILNLTRRPLRRFLFNRLLARAAAVSVLSRFNARLLAEKTTVTLPKIRLTPGALRADFAASLPAETTPPATAHSGKTPPLTVVSVARIHPRKGQHALLEALALLPEKLRGNIVVKFAGRVVRPAYQTRLEKLATACGVPVAFLGEVPDADLPTLYAASDIFALTSLPLARSIEGFGLVYLEAAACRLPVVAHDTGGVGDAVRSGETGLLVPPDDRRALANALQELLKSPALRHRLGENGRRHARQFSWANSAAVLLADTAAPLFP